MQVTKMAAQDNIELAQGRWQSTSRLIFDEDAWQDRKETHQTSEITDNEGCCEPGPF